METEFLCIRCARHMKTCCQTSEVYTTPGDVERIADHTGNREFYEFRPPDDPVYLKQDDDPIWPQLVFKKPDGTRRILKRRENGDCVFLGERGCVLPLETRPLLCRIYPFDFNEQGIHPRLAKGCPTELLHQPEASARDTHQPEASARSSADSSSLTLRVGVSGYNAIENSLLAALDMQQTDAEHWRRQLYAELPQELTADDYRTDL